MTDNRTAELREKLGERGVSCQTHYLHASWCVGPKLYEAVDNLDGTLTVSSLTPEQAIAATLGSDESAVRLTERFRSIADEMRNVGASTMTPHELLAFYAREVDKVADLLKFVAELGSEREMALEELVRSLYADYYSEWPDRAEEAYAERMKELGIEVIDE